MDITINASVVGDGFTGHIVGLIVNPIKYQVTHLLVAAKGARQEVLVPIQNIQAATAQAVRLTPHFEPTPLAGPPPANTIVVRRDARIRASDGAIGHLWRLSITPRTGHIVNLVAREGLLQGHRTITLPDSLLGRMEPDAIHIKADRESLRWLKHHRE